MSQFVLDASALLALLNQEPGSAALAPILPNAAISTVNFAEVVTKLIEIGIPERLVHQILDDLALEVVPYEQSMAYRTGELRGITKAYGLSLGDRACLALAIARQQPVLTSDRVWANLELGIEVQIIR